MDRTGVAGLLSHLDALAVASVLGLSALSATGAPFAIVAFLAVTLLVCRCARQEQSLAHMYVRLLDRTAPVCQAHERARPARSYLRFVPVACDEV